ncbi:MAG: hypothetical protein DRH56_08120 [Deltaproteobacteria bacterium]|nr:MAG: hypothetical protein DRH56_08120 [Deltaproteobacteria bacterium]
MDDRTPLEAVLRKVSSFLDEKGIDVLDPYHRANFHPGSLARPRIFEIAAAINRLRSVRFVSPDPGKRGPTEP